MKMNLVLELLDVPGQLVSVLEPIGSLGANLVTVIHKREFKNEQGMVPVHLTIEGERENLFNVIQKFDDLGISIVEMDGVVKKEMISTLLYGHIVDQDDELRDDRRHGHGHHGLRHRHLLKETLVFFFLSPHGGTSFRSFVSYH